MIWLAVTAVQMIAQSGEKATRDRLMGAFLHLAEGELPLALPLQFRRVSPIRRRETATAWGGSAMLRNLRTLLAALAVVATLAAPATSTLAASSVEMIENEKAPPMVDLFVMRPLGLVFLGVSGAIWVPAQAFTMMIRPRDYQKPINAMLQRP